MKKNIVIFLATAILVYFAIFFSKKENGECSLCVQKGTEALIVGTNAQFPPYEFLENGEIVGFDIDLIKEVAHRMGKEIRLKDFDFDMLLLEAEVGNIQVIAAALTPTPEREQKILFTQNYLEGDELIVVTRADNNSMSINRPTELADLKGKEVVVNEGFTADRYVSADPDIMIKRLGTVSDALLALSLGRADAFVTAKSAVAPFFAQHDAALFVTAALPVLEQYAFGVSKRHAHLLEPIKKSLEEIVRDGTLEKIKSKWHILSS